MLTVCETCLSKRSRARHADQIPSFRASVIKRIFNTRVVLCLLNESLKTNVSLSPGGQPVGGASLAGPVSFCITYKPTSPS